VNFQFPIQYGGFSAADGFETDFDRVWPIAGVADMQGSMGRVRMPLGVLNHLTAANGPAIVRGHRVPADLQGDLLFAEPVGRLIRRAKIVKTEGMTQLRNPYPGSEFLLSSDLCFRPVNIRTGPDGAIYIADMYHGIIQESTWTKPGRTCAGASSSISSTRSWTAGASGGCVRLGSRRDRHRHRRRQRHRDRRTAGRRRPWRSTPRSRAC
jgi:hypothetical protein